MLMKNIHISLMMLRVLDALDKEGSHTRAGELLGLTQSGVSHAMRAWEDALGAPLAERDGRTFKLTPLGEAVLREARQALDHIEVIGRLADRKPLAGHVRLGTVASAAIALVPPALDTLRRLHPNLSVELIEGTDLEVREWFEHGIVDVAIAMEKLGPATRVLRTTEMVAVIPRLHPLAGLRVIKPSALAEYPFVMSASGCEPLILSHARAMGVTLDVALRVRDSRALLAAVRSGLGVTVLPMLTIGASPDGLVYRPLHPPLRRDLHIGIANQRSESARALVGELNAVP
jgi:DNA-binding transcriptional LysR family regulator